MLASQPTTAEALPPTFEADVVGTVASIKYGQLKLVAHLSTPIELNHGQDSLDDLTPHDRSFGDLWTKKENVHASASSFECPLHVADEVSEHN